MSAIGKADISVDRDVGKVHKQKFCALTDLTLEYH